MRRLRALVRALAIGGLTFLLGVPAWLLATVDGHRRAGRSARARHALFRRWSRGVLRLCGARLEVDGDAPPSPFFLVCNHLGYVDIVALAAVLDDAVFVAQHGVAGWPVIGALARAVGTIFVDRGDLAALPEVNRQVGSALDDGRSVVVFPEGTTTPGVAILPFMSPVLEPAAGRGLAVRAAALSYHCPHGERPAHEAICWWGDMTFADHLARLLEVPHFDIGLRFVAEPSLDPDRKALARALHGRVLGAFTPTVTGDDAWRIPWP